MKYSQETEMIKEELNDLIKEIQSGLPKRDNNQRKKFLIARLSSVKKEIEYLEEDLIKDSNRSRIVIYCDRCKMTHMFIEDEYIDKPVKPAADS